jgi:hypothetical protein
MMVVLMGVSLEGGGACFSWIHLSRFGVYFHLNQEYDLPTPLSFPFNHTQELFESFGNLLSYRIIYDRYCILLCSRVTRVDPDEFRSSLMRSHAYFSKSSCTSAHLPFSVFYAMPAPTARQEVQRLRLPPAALPTVPVIATTANSWMV